MVQPFDEDDRTENEIIYQATVLLNRLLPKDREWTWHHEKKQIGKYSMIVSESVMNGMIEATHIVDRLRFLLNDLKITHYADKIPGYKASLHNLVTIAKDRKTGKYNIHISDHIIEALLNIEDVDKRIDEVLKKNQK